MFTTLITIFKNVTPKLVTPSIASIGTKSQHKVLQNKRLHKSQAINAKYTFFVVNLSIVTSAASRVRFLTQLLRQTNCRAMNARNGTHDFVAEL